MPSEKSVDWERLRARRIVRIVCRRLKCCIINYWFLWCASKLTNRNIHYIQTAVKSPTSWRDEMTLLHALKVALGDSEWSWPQGSTKSSVVYCDSQGPWQDIGDTVELATSTWTTPINAT
ncbi:hypothetical protein PLEOSDRAFT_1082197 [Pleurotus ostreatus PC15]|uniref:Uncharacterized protein n=1 Tax=Pleurotus ostreatus (strain PC15) TaxID=1137138 RepID=A0A067P3I6_PLEO1|nr:hypothetical protein PLEOSDRAFT_1082197 [Pleurotus ostreatus PC15]